MIPVVLTALALGDAGGPALSTQGRSAPPAERAFRVGQIFIEGADDMSASAILKELDFQTGDSVTPTQLREAERRLAALGVFVVDPRSDVRPRVVPLLHGGDADLRIVVRRSR